ncbi:MAG TPA: IS3 family transposase [Verrucomicrobiae bacterium]|nr:IS3 family transposase [Verrucomicrobiae bacterium]
MKHSQVSPSGYYGWLERRTQPGLRACENATLAKDVQAIHEESRQTYGSPRIVMELRKQGKQHGRNRVPQPE